MNEKLVEAIKSRKSVRQYKDILLTEEEIAKIKEYLSNSNNFETPFGSKVRIELKDDLKTMPVKKAPKYAVLVTPINQNGLIDGGYVFEKFIIYLESIGLNTCQIGMFKREEVVLDVKAEEGQMILLCTPIGHGTEKASFKEKAIKAIIGSKRRKELDEMFFENDKMEAVKDERKRGCLDLVRWAPSALNSQPWRIIFDGEKAHFYIGAKEHARNHGGLNIHTLDVGISLYHYMVAFDKGLQESKIAIDEEAPKKADMDYLFSVE